MPDATLAFQWQCLNFIPFQDYAKELAVADGLTCHSTVERVFLFQVGRMVVTGPKESCDRFVEDIAECLEECSPIGGLSE